MPKVGVERIIVERVLPDVALVADGAVTTHSPIPRTLSRRTLELCNLLITDRLYEGIR